MQGAQKTAIAFALGRIAFGVGLVAAPQRVAKGWLAQDARRPSTQVAIRGLGARDIALAGRVESEQLSSQTREQLLSAFRGWRVRS